MTVALERRCENCDRRLGPSRRDRKFCTTACRVAAHRARRLTVDEVPQPLQLEIERILAQATREERLVLQVAAAAAKGQWRASAWLLERRWPQRWGRPEKRPAVEAVVDRAPNAIDDLFAEVDEIRARRERRADERGQG